MLPSISLVQVRPNTWSGPSVSKRRFVLQTGLFGLFCSLHFADADADPLVEPATDPVKVKLASPSQLPLPSQATSSSFRQSVPTSVTSSHDSKPSNGFQIAEPSVKSMSKLGGGGSAAELCGPIAARATSSANRSMAFFMQVSSGGACDLHHLPLVVETAVI